MVTQMNGQEIKLRKPPKEVEEVIQGLPLREEQKEEEQKNDNSSTD
jgi:hypothetical protein